MYLEKVQSTSQGSSNVLWALMCLCIFQVNHLFAQLSSTWDDSHALKKSQKWCNKAVVSCIVFAIMLGKVADQGPHTNCTSHSLTFPSPLDLQPSFWASINNRESPSLSTTLILSSLISLSVTGGIPIFSSFVAWSFIRFTRGEKTTTIMASSSTHCAANKRQSLIDKQFAKSRREIYELIGLRNKICRIASLWYLFNSVLITNFFHTQSKASLIVRILTSGSGYVLQKSVNGLWLVNVHVGCV